jgi:hypothetical protein
MGAENGYPGLILRAIRPDRDLGASSGEAD